MAIAKRTGREENAKPPMVAMNLKKTCKTGFPSQGKASIVADPEKALPTPSMRPIKASRATGSMKVLPSPWKNSYTPDDFERVGFISTSLPGRLLQFHHHPAGPARQGFTDIL